MLGGTQSLHTNSYDEAIALPTEKAARLALRTQQVLAYETDVTAHRRPVRRLVRRRVADRRGRGGRRRADDGKVEDRRRRGRRASSRASRRTRSSSPRTAVAQEIDSGERVVVGVNRFPLDEEEPYEPLRVDPAIEAEQAERLAWSGALTRSGPAVDPALDGPEDGRRGHGQRALPHEGRTRGPAPPSARSATRLREVWGTYVPPTPSTTAGPEDLGAQADTGPGRRRGLRRLPGPPDVPVRPHGGTVSGLARPCAPPRTTLTAGPTPPPGASVPRAKAASSAAPEGGFEEPYAVHSSAGGARSPARIASSPTASRVSAVSDESR